MLTLDHSVRLSRSAAIIALIAALLCTVHVRATDEIDVSVAVDPRVELMSIIFRLAGNPEYNQGRLTSYLADIDVHFGPHRGHPVIQTAQELRRKRGVSYDAVMSMAVHTTDAFELRERVPFDAKDVGLDSRWRASEAREFLKQARDFVNVSNFREFLDQHRQLHALAGERMQALLDEHADLAWFESFFGARPTARFIVVPGPVNGGQAFGPSVRMPDGQEELFAIIGIWQMDQDGQPKFDQTVLATVIHEFCHSFVNHLVDQHEKELRRAGEKIFPLVAEKMKRQAYGNWQTMMKESVVRAAVIRYLLAHDAAAARQQMEDDKRRGFHWMPQLVELIAAYENDRAALPTFDLFMPRIVNFFDEIAPRLADDLRKAEDELNARRPKIESIVPANGADDVDPSTAFIVITFDRPMDTRGHSIMFGPGGRASLPNIGFASYDETGRIFTIKVQLEPNRKYEFSLNGENGGHFKAVDGTPLKMTPVGFATGAAK